MFIIVLIVLITSPLSKSEKKSIIYIVTKLNREFCVKLKEARRSAGLSQTVVANDVGCKQSALCSFERGDCTKLNDEVIRRLAEKFSIDLSLYVGKSKAVAEAVITTGGSSTGRATGFCPNPDCPSNHRYEVGGISFMKPELSEADPVGGRFCALCGEVLERKCPECGAKVHPGAVCQFCGRPYIVVDDQ